MSHTHSAPSDRRRLSIAFAITSAVLIAQAIGAVLTGSLALLVDTGHMLTDVAGLGLALFAAQVMRRPPSPARTWGYRRAEVLAALAQASVLFAVGLYVLISGALRLGHPPDVPARELVIFGVIGLLGNLLSMAVLAGGHQANLNMRAAFLEVVNDALGSVGVIAAALVIATTGWQRADAVAGLAIGALIVPRALRLIRETVGVLLESTPPGLDLRDVRAHLLGVNHVLAVHDLHASLIATGLPVLSAHVVVDDSCFQDGHAGRMLAELQHCVGEHFDVSIEHSTFQIEPASHDDRKHSRHD